jgi:hypothetical protein
VTLLKVYLFPLLKIDTDNALDAIVNVGQKLTEYFKIVYQKTSTSNLYERFGFGKHHGKLITFAIHIEYQEDTFNRGVFPTTVANGSKKK